MRLVCSLSLASCTLLAAPTAAAPSKCRTLRGTDLAPARYVKLVAQANGDGGFDLVGCVLPRGPLVRVASSADLYTTTYGYALRQVAGRTVLVDSSYDSQYASTQSTTVVDLRSGRRYDLARRVCMVGANPCEETASAPAAFVTNAGRAVALVLDHGSASVTAFSTLGRARVLDGGASDAIAPASLSLAGNVATWTNAGLTRSASITAG